LQALAVLGVMPSQALAQALPNILGRPQPFSWDLLKQRAATLAGQPWREPRKNAAAAALDYDKVGSISYRADRTLAGGIRLFPLGRYAPMPIALSIVEGGSARAVNFTPDLFRAASGHAAALGIAGFRAMTPDGKSDWLAFMGASYFRAAGSQDQYGLSARGIAVNTGIDGQEEFPAFTDFWIEAAGGDAFTIYALLDGPSLTGAFRFVSRHDKTGVTQDVSSELHIRKEIARLGIAPATSMFWYGEGNRAAAIDWRPEIHDSDGLGLWTGAGERIWRPLANPSHATLDSFQDSDPKGFGLLQRDRVFDHYQDDGAFYDRRPNLWVEPKGSWGKGAVTLFAFPTATETVDNVVAFWVPATPPRPGQSMQFDYRLTWTSTDPTLSSAAHVVDCWRGTAGPPGVDPIKGATKLVADFVGERLAGLDRSSGVTVQIDAGANKVLASAAYPVVGVANRWRITADITTGGSGAVNVRAFLKRGGTALSETLLTQL
jgi:periplasmic glucans biosynthesis protein